MLRFSMRFNAFVVALNHSDSGILGFSLPLISRPADLFIKIVPVTNDSLEKHGAICGILTI